MKRTRRKFTWKTPGGGQRTDTLPKVRKRITLADGSEHEVEVTVCPKQWASGHNRQPHGRISNKLR